MLAGIAGETRERFPSAGAPAGADGADQSDSRPTREGGQAGEESGVRFRARDALQCHARGVGGGLRGEQASQYGHGGGGADERQLAAEEVAPCGGYGWVREGAEQLRLQLGQTGDWRAADLFADDRGERTIAAVFQADDLAPRINIRAGFGADYDDAVG